MFACFFLEIVNYVVVNKTIENDPTWSKHIKEQCGDEDLKEAFQQRSMVDNGQIGFCFGCYFGLILAAKMWPNIHRGVLKNETLWKPVVRIMISALMMLPFGLVFLLLKPEHIENVYMLMIIKVLIPTFAMGFILFGISDRVNMKLNLLQVTEPTNCIEIPDPEISAINGNGEEV